MEPRSSVLPTSVMPASKGPIPTICASETPANVAFRNCRVGHRVSVPLA